MTDAPIHQRAFLLTYLRPQTRRVAVLAALLLASIAFDVLNPLLLRSFIDGALRGEPLAALTTTALLFLAVALAHQLVAVAETYLAENVGLTATNRLRTDLALHCLGLDPAFHNAHTPGELIERVDGDVATLGNFFARFVVHMLGNLLLLIAVLGLLFSIDWRVGAALTAFALVTLVVLSSLRDIAVPHWGAARQAEATLFGFLEERLAGTEDIRASGATAHTMRQLQGQSRTVLSRQRHAGLLSSATGSTTIVLFAIGTAIALALGAALFQSGTISLGTVYLIFSYTQLLSRPIEQISRQIQDLQQAGASVVRIRELFGLRSSVSDGPGAHWEQQPRRVEFDHVSFGYPEQGPVLHDLTFAIEPGAVLGVLGRTGSGKSTLARLLLRLYDPGHGRVRLDGVDLRQARIAQIRQHVGMVTQDIQLFNATVRDNLTLFDPAIPDDQIIGVLHELGLSDWHASLASGLDTLLESGGRDISAGQAQLLAFARVFLRNPGVVILDEASSRLDPATEQRVERAVDRLLAGRTGVIIAHRLSTVQRADSILILDHGRVLEYGAREALAADPTSHFARLLQTGYEEALA
jgi:ATP-binding cassette subfamily B protein